MTLALFTLACLALIGFTFVTGFRDAPNATAIPVKARALTPKIALRLSALFNFIGMALTGIVLGPLTHHWLTVPHDNTGLGLVLAALISVIAWGLITWWFRIPSSSTHALLGGLAGAAWAARTTGLGDFSPFSDPLTTFILGPLVLAPILLFAVAYAAVFPLYKLLQRTYPATVNRFSRIILSLSNSVISLIHGIQTGQRAVVIYAVLLLSAGLEIHHTTYTIATLFLATVLALGTARGSSRIGYTFAHQMVRLDPFRGAVAQSCAALALVLLQFFLNTPVSSSHLSASAVLGAGMNQRYAAVRHKIVLRIVLTWVITMPLCFLLSAVLFLALSPLL
ncbi:inorganic phosphate transporter [Rothia nasisuis]|uniref:inorganic phosphate transporter n=1 Tax=Rothia nasisuis TaxID=2109647 RepID=UPI001F1BFB36|nr:inorganic phosphate transporter [Rothia nasisuis]